MITLDSLQKQIDSLKEQNQLILEQLKLIIPNKSAVEKIVLVESKTSEIESKKIESPKSLETDNNSASKHSKIEENIGIKWLSIIGALVLTCGVGFFIKFAIDNNLISYLGRIVLGVLVGIGLIAIGASFRKRKVHEILQKVLIGGGLSLIYFVLYLMYSLESYRQAIGVSFSLTIVLLLLVVAVSLYYSIKDKSQIITLLALIFAFVTSLLGDHFTTFTLIYNLIVALAFIVVAFKMGWPQFYIFSLISTYLTYIIWLANNHESFATALVFVLIYFVIYALQALLINTRTLVPEKEESYLELINTIGYYINSIFFLGIGAFLFDKFHPDFLNFFIFCLAMFNFFICYITLKIKKTVLMRSIFFFANALLLYTIFAGFGAAVISAYLLLLIAVYFVTWLIFSYTDLVLMVNIISGIVFYKLLFFDSYKLSHFNVLHVLVLGRAQLFLLVATIFYLIYLVLSLIKERVDGVKYKNLYSWMSFGALVLIAALEMGKYQLSATWIALSLILLAIGFYFKKSEFRYQGLLLFSFTSLKILFYDFSLSNVVYRTILFIVFGVILLLTSFFYSKFKDKLK